MTSNLTDTALQVNGTQLITGIKTTLNNSDSEVPTSKAVKDFVDSVAEAVSFIITGNWSNQQYISSTVDYTGLIFLVTLPNGNVVNATVSSVSPSTWSSTAGTQTATFTCTAGGFSFTAAKTANVAVPSISITLTNPNSGLAFRSISGNLYTDINCTSPASTGTNYTGTTFYYKSNEATPTGSYLYNYGDGGWSSSEPLMNTLTTYYNEGSLTACLGTSGGCWSSDKMKLWTKTTYYYIDLSSGSPASSSNNYENHMLVRESSF